MRGRKPGFIVTEETKNKMSIASKGKKKSSEHVKNVVAARMKSYGCGWKGDDAGKKAMHAWIEKILGKPKHCEHCERTDKKMYDWSNKDHTYKRNVEDYQRLCRSCHMKYDFANNLR